MISDTHPSVHHPEEYRFCSRCSKPYHACSFNMVIAWDARLLAKRKAMQHVFPGISLRCRFLVGAALLDTLSACATIVQMTLLSLIVAGVMLAHHHLEQVFPRLLLLLGMMIVHAGLVWVREMTVQYGAIRCKNAVRQRLFAHLFLLGPAYCKGESTGELVTVLNEGIERLDTFVSRYLPQLAASVLVPLVLVAAIFPLDWVSGVLLLVTGPIIPLLMMLVGSFAERHIQRQWQALARMGATLLDAIQGLSTLKLFGQSEAASKGIVQISDRFRVKTLKVLRVAFLSGAVLEFMVAAAIGLIAVTLGVRLVNGDISFERAFLVLLLAPAFYAPLRELGAQHHAGMEGRAAGKRIGEIVAMPIPGPLSSETPPAPLSPLTITFSDVTYIYAGNEQPALQGIHLELSAGSCTALIGRSGAGKSTLVNLLMRFLEPQSGRIRVNGIDLADLPVRTWRESIALVPQRPSIFAGSVLDNLRLARPDADDREVAEAAELAGAAAFIAQLPQGYATLLGERGARLSAGQMQRLAIARAFLKNAPLLILDEPTSSLDPESETLIRQALERLTRHRTVLVVAHRENTIVGSQQIAVLDAGKLVKVCDSAALLHPHDVASNLAPFLGKTEVA
jgi:ATP-binding cassette subfamily C protein CydD